ncbi:MAG: hypothetical protein GY838_00650 [bacterium]|nr:hypothetical protein [bacterium]
MQLTINELAISIGEGAPPADLAGAGFKRCSLIKRLLKKEPRGGRVFETDNCIVTCFDDSFELYPCTHSYLTPDRRWRTAASILLVNDQIASAVLHIIDAKYAATEFVSQFQEACLAELGEPEKTDRYTARWQNGTTEVTSLLRPDTKNASFLFQAKPAVVRS